MTCFDQNVHPTCLVSTSMTLEGLDLKGMVDKPDQMGISHWENEVAPNLVSASIIALIVVMSMTLYSGAFSETFQMLC